MIVALIVACEVAFWVLLAVGLALRYLARKPRAGAAVLLCEPLLEVVLLIVTAIDLRNGAEPSIKHGLAAVYIGFTATHGHYLVKRADGYAAHWLGRGPKPAKPPRYGMARAVHEWKMGLRAIGGAAIAAALLQIAVWYVGSPEQTESLRAWQAKMGLVSAVSAVWALSYTVWPKRPKPGETGEAGEAGKMSELGGLGEPGGEGTTPGSPGEASRPRGRLSSTAHPPSPSHSRFASRWR